MSKLEELKISLNEDENIKRFKQLEAIIDKDATLNQQYKVLQDVQKIMVQKDAKKIDSTIATANYNKQLDTVLDHVLMSEYLDLLEVVNNELQFIKSIITKEIDMDFE